LNQGPIKLQSIALLLSYTPILSCIHSLLVIDLEVVPAIPRNDPNVEQMAMKTAAFTGVCVLSVCISITHAYSKYTGDF
jgi:hypothetical protein